MNTVLHAARREPYRRLFPTHGLPPAAVRIVRLFAREPQLSVGEMSRLTGYTLNELSEYLLILLKAGLVCRVETAPGLYCLAHRERGER